MNIFFKHYGAIQPLFECDTDKKQTNLLQPSTA